MSNNKRKAVIKNRNKKGKLSFNKTTIDYPIFCFKYLTIKAKGDFKFYYNFILRLKQLSELGWKQIQTSPKHSFGTEKIPVNKIKKDMPKFVTPDVENLIVFRASGDNRPFLGLRNGNIFHIIFIEEKFGDIYDHS